MPTEPVRAVCIRVGRRGHTLPADAPPLVLQPDPSGAVPWGGVRLLLALLRRRRGDAAVERALAPDRALLSLALRGLDASLTPAERSARDRQGARFLGSLPHAGLFAKPLVHAWARALAALLDGDTIVVPDATRCDPGSLAVLRRLAFALANASSVRVTIGELQARSESAAVAEDGLEDDALRARLAELAAYELRQLGALAGADTNHGDIMGEAAAAPSPSPSLSASLDPLDDGVEHRALALVAAREGPLGEADGELVLGAIRRAFDAYGFVATLVLARAWIARVRATRDAPEVHLLAGLAASNLADPHTGVVDELTRRADEHFAAVAAAEGDPIRRAHILYRLCIRTARKQGDFAAARELGDRAVAACAGLPPWAASYFEAWARNARAYARFRLGQREAACADCERGLSLLAGMDDAVPAVDVAITRFHLQNNLARLAHASGLRETARTWQSEASACEVSIPSERRTFYRWYDVALDAEAPETAMALYARRLDEAERDGEPMLASLYAHDLGTLLFRLGDAEAAYRAFTKALALRRELDRGEPDDDLVATEVNCAVSAYRARRFDAAAAHFDALLTGPFALASPERAELSAGSAIALAACGERCRAERRCDEAIAMAEQAGDTGALVRVLRSAAETALLAEQPIRARDLLDRALELARGGEDSPPEDELGLLAAQLDSGLAPPDALDRALVLLPAALADVNGWWELPRLLGVVLRVGERDILARACDPAPREALARLADAGALRADTTRPAEALRGWLGREVGSRGEGG